MLALFFLFIVTPVLELFLLVRVGRIVGLGPTVGFVVAMGLLGALLAKSQGRKVIRQWQAATAQGEVPEEGVLGGVLVLLGALLMILPGVLTDIAGLLLMIPAVRRRMARTLGSYLAAKIASGQLQVYGAPGMRPSMRPRPSAPTEVGRSSFRPGEVIDTQGEDVE